MRGRDSCPGYTCTDSRCSIRSAPEGVKVDETIQVELTIDILKQIYKEPKKETRKQLCQLLGKLHIPDSLDEWQCKNILLLVSQLDNVSAQHTSGSVARLIMLSSSR